MIGNKLIGLVLPGLVASTAEAGVSINFTNLKNGQKVKSPVEVCMQAQGVVIESVQNGVREGHGHLHILVDVALPPNLDAPLPMDRPGQFVHLGDGSNCRTLELSPGRHQLRALLANGAHVPGKPVVTRLIKITVE